MARRLAISALCAGGALFFVHPDLVPFAAALTLLAVVGGGLVLWRRAASGHGALLAPVAVTRRGRHVRLGGPADAGATPALVLLSQPRR